MIQVQNKRFPHFDQLISSRFHSLTRTDCNYLFTKFQFTQEQYLVDKIFLIRAGLEKYLFTIEIFQTWKTQFGNFLIFPGPLKTVAYR